MIIKRFFKPIYFATQCLFKKIVTWPNYKKMLCKILTIEQMDYYNCNYSDIISLGYNCEVSQRFVDIFTNSEFKHFLFTWSYENDRNGFLGALMNLDYFTDSEYKLLPNGMLKNEKYDIDFHPLCPIEVFTNGKEDVSKYLPDIIDELISRSNHLAMNLLKVFCEENRSILFVMKMKYKNVQDDIKFLEKLNDILADSVNPSSKYTILVVLSKQDYKRKYRKELFKTKIDNVEYAMVSRYAKDESTDVDGDLIGWYRILRSYIKPRS